MDNIFIETGNVGNLAFDLSRTIQDDHFGLVVSNIGEAVCKLQKGCSRLAAASNKAYQLLAMVGGFLRVLRLLPPLKLVVMI
jgi:hypothetical protein